MKKLLITVVLLFFIHTIQSQEVYFYSGKNFTTYDFTNSSGNSNPNLRSGTGAFYEVGYNKNLKNDRFSYSLAVALNEYNSVGGNTANSYSWHTQYLGFQGGLIYSTIRNSDFDILPKFCFNMGTIISGTQSINGTYFDLTKEQEFSGLLVTPSIGLQLKYNLSTNGFISLGYNYCKSFNLSNSTNQELSFNTNQLQFGIHYTIK